MGLKDKVTYLSPSELKRDKTQPRKIISETKVDELSNNIATVGIINPIEITKDNVIITGEMRWRAAKKLGIEKVPCTVVGIDKKMLFVHQLAENVHNESMNPIDTARALSKVMKTFPERNYQGLGKYIGKSHVFVRNHMNILERSDKFIDAVEKGEIFYSLTEPINHVKNKTDRKALERRVLKEKKLLSKPIAMKMAYAINRNPEKAKEILAIKVKNSKGAKLPIETIEAELRAVIGDKRRELEDYLTSGESIIKQAKLLEKQLRDCPLKEININANEVFVIMNSLAKNMVLYSRGEELPLLSSGNKKIIDQ